MTSAPSSAALSQTQLAVLEQIRALRAAKAPPQAAASAPPPALDAAAPARAVAPVAARPAAPSPLAASAGPMPGNRPRGSILDITV